MVFDDTSETCIVLKLSHPVDVNINESENLYGGKLKIISFVNQDTSSISTSSCSNFNFDGDICYQTPDGNICQSVAKVHKIKMLSCLITKTMEKMEVLNLDQLIYGSQLLKQLYKKQEAVLNPEKYANKIVSIKGYEAERSNDEQRKKYKQKID